MRDRFDVAFANDTDADRHGIVTRSSGLMNPNHFLAAAIAYLFAHRPQWGSDAAIGKTIVSSSIIDRVGEEARTASWSRPRSASNGSSRASATARSASPARRAPAPRSCKRDGSVWTTDKDGIMMGLLAAEMHRQDRTRSEPAVRRTDRRTRRALLRADRCRRRRRSRRALLKALGPEQLGMKELAGEPVRAIADQGARQRSVVRRHQGRDRSAAGSRHGRRAPRTSTRSMRRAFAARIISTDQTTRSARHRACVRSRGA